MLFLMCSIGLYLLFDFTVPYLTYALWHRLMCNYLNLYITFVQIE